MPGIAVSQVKNNIFLISINISLLKEESENRKARGPKLVQNVGGIKSRIVLGTIVCSKF